MGTFANSEDPDEMPHNAAFHQGICTVCQNKINLQTTNNFFLEIILPTVSHLSYAPLFQGPHFLTKMLKSNILYDNLFIDILSV